MQYAKLDPDKHIDCYLGNEDEEQAVYNLARALANEDRIKIIRLILKQPLNIYEIARKLNLPFSTVSNHITVLEDAGLITVETVQGVKRHVKMCGRKLHRIAFYFKNNQQNTQIEVFFDGEILRSRDARKKNNFPGFHDRKGISLEKVFFGEKGLTAGRKIGILKKDARVPRDPYKEGRTLYMNICDRIYPTPLKASVLGGSVRLSGA
jgi:DNA-binding transcriptional ArsR family regulator